MPTGGERPVKSTGSRYAAYALAGTQFGVSAAAGAILGHYLDGRFATAPWLAVGGLAVGFSWGLLNLIRIVRALDLSSGGNDAGRKE